MVLHAGHLPGMTKKILHLAVACFLALVLVPATGSAAMASETGEGLFRLGDRTYFADGTVEVEVPAGTLSLSQCDSDQFCVWSQANYSGSFRYKTGSGVKAIGGTVGSFWNNRTSVARLYSNTGASSACHENGAKKASVTSGYSSASQVNLSASTNC